MKRPMEWIVSRNSFVLDPLCLFLLFILAGNEEQNDEAPPAKKLCKSPSESALDPYNLSQLGVNPPPGLTVTPVGINGGPVSQAPMTHSTGGRAKIAVGSRGSGRPRIISWMDAPDDVYFYASDNTKYVLKRICCFTFTNWRFVSENCAKR